MLLDSQDDTLVRLVHDFNHSRTRKSIKMLICNVGRFDPFRNQGSLDGQNEGKRLLDGHAGGTSGTHQYHSAVSVNSWL